MKKEKGPVPPTEAHKKGKIKPATTTSTKPAKKKKKQPPKSNSDYVEFAANVPAFGLANDFLDNSQNMPAKHE